MDPTDTVPVAPIRRLLIANRGEIAVRIARTARRLGIGTVGIYSDADRAALHVDVMDVAVALGGSTPAESYLRIDAVVDAAVRTGCDAVHPGYGFLAENADAARAVEAAGLRWVGPTPEQITLLGDKIAAKRTAVAAGVPTTPIHEVTPGGPLPSNLAMPVLVKAAAGGGGRGMRVVTSADDLASAIESASREAAGAFGDPTVFIEAYIENGRHIEVQIMGDAHGSVIHLGERDCSVQRRNQKVIEESPAPGLDAAVRRALHDGAVALARHVGYRGAGTVEFLVADDGTITFLEVNTRLQVEHPVTEAVTGLDLVEMQLAVAEGRPLPVAQDDVRFSGHAVEVRIVAEDPASGWLPSTGTITGFSIDDSVRCDSGVRPGSVVSVDYDSLLAKVIAHASERHGALARLAAALRGADIGGVRTDADALIAIVTEPDFVAGGVDTGYLGRHPAVLAGDRPDADAMAAHLVAVSLARATANRSADRHWGFAPAGWRNVATRGQRVTWSETAGPQTVEHRIEYRRSGDSWQVTLGDWPEPGPDGALGDDTRTTRTVRATVDGETWSVEIDGIRQRVRVVAEHETSDGVTWRATSAAGRTRWREHPRFVDHDAEMAGSGPVAPLPGTVIAVAVSAGDRVEANQVLMVIEAMKMEHRITAPADAVVGTVRFAIGDRVDMGDLLVELDTSISD
jgi:propionyl-CoA carboxylase alpha chain